MKPLEIVQQLRSRIDYAHRSQPSFVKVMTEAADTIERMYAERGTAFNAGLEEAAKIADEEYYRHHGLNPDYEEACIEIAKEIRWRLSRKEEQE